MPLNFPTSPTTNDEYSFGGKTWVYNGAGWALKSIPLTTANVNESGNLYYTDARVYANVESIGYSSNSYVNNRLATKANVADLNTSNVTEGNNLYFTNTRSISSLTAGSGILISSNGLITSTVTSSAGFVDSSISEFPTGDFGSGESFVSNNNTSDAFGVSIIDIYDCMEPNGRIITEDLGALT